VEIPLTQGKVALIDDEDYDKIKDYKWYACRRRSVFVAQTWDSKFMHRIIMDAKSGEMVDHINGDPLDNRRQNLRLVTNKQNLQNSCKWTKGTSQYKGVSWQSTRHKWLAQIMVDGKVKFLGYHETELEAAKAYNEGAVKYFGEYANVNKL
jgi:hypothetical protein